MPPVKELRPFVHIPFNLSLSQVKELDSAPTFLFLPDEGRRRLRHPTQPLQSQLKRWFPLLQSMARIPSCSSPMPPLFGPCARGAVRQALANRYCVALCEEVLAESIKQQLARLLSRFSRTCLAVVLDVRVSPGSFAVHRYLQLGLAQRAHAHTIDGKEEIQQ
jgi:hypothetical protein